MEESKIDNIIERVIERNCNGELMGCYWMDEETGEFKPIVLNFLNNKILTNEELDYMKKYVIQWIDGFIVVSLRHHPNLRGYIAKCIPEDYFKKIPKFNQKELMNFVHGEIIPRGIDPF